MNSTNGEARIDRRKFLELAAVTSGAVLASGLPACASTGARTMSSVGSTRGFSPAGLARVHEVMAGYVERGLLPGVVTLLARGGEVHADAIGMKALGGSDPMRRDTIFRIASMTKPVTAAATMILVEEGKVRLDEPVDRWLRGCAMTRPTLHSSVSEAGRILFAPNFSRTRSTVFASRRSRSVSASGSASAPNRVS
jgi:CubicO group peptidase (beta-lactamase class C family)